MEEFEIDINGLKWKITEKNSNEILTIYNEGNRNEDKAIYCFGMLNLPSQRIYINSEMCENQKKLTLKHELMHAYFRSVGILGNKEYLEEDICEIVSTSNEIIYKITEKYFKKHLNLKI